MSVGERVEFCRGYAGHYGWYIHHRSDRIPHMQTQTRENPPSPDDAITGDIIRAAIEVHKELGGPGLLESIYKGALSFELVKTGHIVEREAAVPVIYKGTVLGDPLKIDLLVDRRVIVEAKAVSRYNPVFAVQCNTYLRLT